MSGAAGLERTVVGNTTRIPDNYKKTEVGIIPAQWEASSVGQEFNVELGKMLDAEKNVGELCPYIGNSSIQWGRVDVSNLGVIRLTRADKSRFRLRYGDLLVCEGGEVGRAAIWQDEVTECYYQKALHRLRPKHAFNVRLMLFYLEYMSRKGTFANYVTQTSIAHLPKDKFETIRIPKPPSIEQQAIAEALSDADALIEGLEQLVAKKRAIKQGAMQELLTGKRRLPGFRGEWCRKTIGDFQPYITSGSRGWAAFYSEMGSPFIRITNLSRDHIELDLSDLRFVNLRGQASEAARTELRAEDILISITADLGIIGFVTEELCSPSYINQHIALMRFDLSEVSPRFLSYALALKSTHAAILKLNDASAKAGLNLETIKRIELAVPPTIKEQASIASILSDFDADIRALEAKLAKAHALKQGMMQELLTGRVRLV